ncbi:unnamed protein product [Anisakis simplex]|uniref:Calpain_III domain-containing protein n=1 Tax=Anisakis simplex TaxID=6269 RepID=A0A0M3J7F8_ANISI|nr:unnamed protein product [Anisakis simplex]
MSLMQFQANGISGRLDEDYFRSHKPCARGPAFFNIREVTARIRVPPGDYVIIPSTFEPNQEAQFLLRIYTNGFIESESVPSCFQKKFLYS